MQLGPSSALNSADGQPLRVPQAGPSNANSDGSEEQPVRVATACLPCRTRRHRCSGTQPCAQCLKMHREASCIYAPSKRGKNQYSRQFDGDEGPQEAPSKARKRDDRTLIDNTSSSDAAGPMAGFPLNATNLVTVPEMVPSMPVFFDPCPSLHGARSPLMPLPSTSAHARSTPAFVNGHSPSPSPLPQSTTFDALALFDRMRTSGMLNSEMGGLSQASSNPPLNMDTLYGNVDYALMPARDVVDPLVQQFLEQAQGTYPILHIPSFLRDYEGVWVPQDGFEPLSPHYFALLNIVCAIGSYFLHASTGETAEADEFANRSRRILAVNAVFGQGGLLGTQTLIWLVFYSQIQSTTAECWNSLGLAIRMAMALGMQYEPAPSANRDPVLAEQRRRAWWGCYILDASLSCVFGRASSLSNVVATAEYPSAFPDEALEVYPRWAMFRHNVVLAKLLCRILDTLYLPEQQSQTEQMTAMLRIEKEMVDWRKQLPTYLRFDATPDNDAPPWVTRHRAVLHSRYLHVRLMAFRPSLAFGLDQAADSASPFRLELASSTWATAARLCLDTAHKLIDVCQAAPAHLGQGNSAWYQTAYLFAACAVLLASRWRGNGLDTFDHAWARATYVLRRSRPAAAATLDALREKLAAPGRPSASGFNLAEELDGLLGGPGEGVSWTDLFTPRS